MEEKAKWADEAIASIEGIERARPSDTLFATIKSEMTNKSQVKIIPLRKLYLVAVAACAILVLNVFAFSFEVSESPNGSESNILQSQLLTDFNLYK